MAVDILIVLNNFIHDLSAALWFCGTCTLYFIASEGRKTEASRPFIQALFGRVKRLTHLSLAVVIAGGIVRAFAFSRYEWMPALGREQVALLVAKHILLAAIVAGAFWLQAGLSRQMKALGTD